MKMFFLSLCILCLCVRTTAQSNSLADSLQKEYAHAKDPKKRAQVLEELAWVTMSINPAQADKYGEEQIQIAERSRDKEAIVKAYTANGMRCGAMAGMLDYTSRAMDYYGKALAIAQKNHLSNKESFILLQEANLQLKVPDIDNASKLLDKASTIVMQNNDDSAHAVIAIVRGNIQLERNQKIDALRSFLSALRLADNIKNANLQRQSLLKLSGFYASIEDYDKAIDYYAEAGTRLEDMDLKTKIGYYRTADVKALGDLYAAKKSYPLAIENYNQSIAMADSMNYPPLKVPAYIGLLNVYILMKEPQKSLDFMSSENGRKLKEYLTQVNFSAFIDQGYAIIYSELGQLDSAGKYFDRSADFFNSSTNVISKMNNYIHKAFYLKRRGNNQQAVDLLLQARTIATTNGQLEMGLEISKNLDTLYERLGDYRQSKVYSAEYFLLKDSLQTINKEKELSQVEAEDELKQVQKLELAAAEKKRQRNNLQYLAITLGIATIFLLLVVLGMFRVSARTIKILGFFAFLMFFEFVFLLFKKNIYAISHGEPWIDLSFMIGLAAILVPLHHWLEHKVLHYLTAKNKLTSVGETLRERFARKEKVMEG